MLVGSFRRWVVKFRDVWILYQEIIFLGRRGTSSDLRDEISLLGARFVGLQCAKKKRIVYSLLAIH
jgi:hypothetical protein